MAVINSVYMRGAKQKLGGVVFYQQKGRTLARELAPLVSNPRTTSQMSQRTKLANVVAMYRANKSWMRGSFEDKSQQESDYNAFVKANLSASLVTQSKSEAAANACVVAPYKVTSGSLPSIEQEDDGGALITNLYIGNLEFYPNTTVQDLSNALIANNNGIEEGMQLSLIVNIQRSNVNTGIPYVIVRAYEMIISTRNLSPISDYFGSVTFTEEGDENKTLVAGLEDLNPCAATFILSKTTSGRTAVSSQSLVMLGQNSVYNTYTSPGKAAVDAESYGESTEDFLDSNEANTAGNVPISNQIMSVRYDDTRIMPGGVIAGPISQNDTMLAFFSRAITDGESAVPTLTNRRTNETYQLNRDFDPTAPDVIEIVFLEEIEVENDTPMRLQIPVDGSISIFDFILTGGDID